jgi:hypothetical protein
VSGCTGSATTNAGGATAFFPREQALSDKNAIAASVPTAIRITGVTRIARATSIERIDGSAPSAAPDKRPAETFTIKLMASPTSHNLGPDRINSY